MDIRSYEEWCYETWRRNHPAGTTHYKFYQLSEYDQLRWRDYVHAHPERFTTDECAMPDHQRDFILESLCSGSSS